MYGPSVARSSGWNSATSGSRTTAPRRRFDYTAPVFDYRGLLVYDASGLVLDYPGIAIRNI
jgi:hypothetical protein